MNNRQKELLQDLIDTKNRQIKQLQQENTNLKERIDKAIEIIESYNLGKYDYTIPPTGIIDLLEMLLEEEKPTEDMNENFIMIRLSDLKSKLQELKDSDVD